MQSRKAVKALEPGDYVVSVKGTAVGGTLTELAPVKDGVVTVGPRGGRYITRATYATPDGNLPGRVALVMENGARLVAAPEWTAVVEVAEEW